MKRVLSVNNMRISDAATIDSGVPGRELMMRAAKGIYNSIYGEAGRVPLRDGLKTLILCGTGNNAGDGYALATLLNEAGAYVDLLLSKEKFSEDGSFYYKQCKELGIKTYLWNDNSNLIRLSDYDVIVDCLLGTGFTGEPRGEIKEIIECVNDLYDSNTYNDSISIGKKINDRPVIISVDINSGLNGDNGLAKCALKSDMTISIGDYMSGLFLNEAKDIVGDLVNIDIGIEPVKEPYYLVEKSDVKAFLPKRLNMSNKGTYGYVALLGGSSKYTGAISLAGKANHGILGGINELSEMANASMRSGAGVVLLAAPSKLCPMLSERILESTVYPLSDNDGDVIFDKEELDILMSRVRVIAFGMGIGDTIQTQDILKYLLNNYHGILLIDADGLNALSKLSMDDKDIFTKSNCEKIILTPHVKEFSRLLEARGFEYSVRNIQEDSIRLASEYADSTNTIVLLKGPTTIITDGQKVYLTDRGCAGMATAGSGDVLSGILAATCGYIKPTINGVVAGAYINGYAGELAEEKFGDISMIASDTVNNIAQAIRDIRE